GPRVAALCLAPRRVHQAPTSRCALLQCSGETALTFTRVYSDARTAVPCSHPATCDLRKCTPCSHASLVNVVFRRGLFTQSLTPSPLVTCLIPHSSPQVPRKFGVREEGHKGK